MGGEGKEGGRRGMLRRMHRPFGVRIVYHNSRDLCVTRGDRPMCQPNRTHCITANGISDDTAANGIQRTHRSVPTRIIKNSLNRTYR